MAVAIIALAAGCGNSGTQTSSAASASSKSASSGAASNTAVSKKTFEDQNDSTFVFSNASLQYGGSKSVFTYTMKHTRDMDIKVKMVQVKLTAADGKYTLLQKDVNEKIEAGKSLEISIEHDGDLTAATKVDYQYQIG